MQLTLKIGGFLFACLLPLVSFAGPLNEKEKLQDFWRDYYTAVSKNDYHSIENTIDFPMQVFTGPLESDGYISVSRAKFPGYIERILKQKMMSVKQEKIVSVRDVILEYPDILQHPRVMMRMREDGTIVAPIQIGPLGFIYKNGHWYWKRAYIELED